jgi:signal recognition particle subunit SRP54
MLQGKFTLDDFLRAMDQMKKMGSLKGLMKMIPGMGQMASAMDAMGEMDPDQDVQRVRAMIQSMTLDERQNPDKIDRSRRNRIAGGSGTDPADVHDLLKQFKGMSGVMQNLAGMSKVDQFRAIQGMQKDMMNPGAGFQKKKERSKRGPTDRSELRDRKKQQRRQAKEQRKRNKKRR